MEALVWVGTAVSLAGLAGLIACIVMAMRARGAGLPDDELRERLRRVVVLNMGALLLSVLGLMLVAAGVFLG